MLLERCQLGEIRDPFEFNYVNGQHGKGIYCYHANNSKMRKYYSRNGENIYQFEVDDKLFIKCRLKDYWDIKRYIFFNKTKKVFQFSHKGPGIPTSVEILVIDPRDIKNIVKINKEV